MNPMPGMIRYDRKDRVTGQIIHVYQHRSGFKIDLIPKPGFKNKYCSFLIPYGAEHLQYRDRFGGELVQAELGTPHFLEHCIFSNFDESGIVTKLSALGVDTDAYTTSTYTLYSFTCVKSFNEALELYFRAVFTPEFSEEKTKREKEIIAAEINMYKEDLSTAAERVLMQGLYRHPVLYEDILGTHESLHKIKTDDLRRMHKNLYTPSTMSLILVGSFEEEEEMIRRISEWLEIYAGGGMRYPEVLPLSLEEGEPVIPEQRLELPASTSSFWIGYKNPLSAREHHRDGNEILRGRLSGKLLSQMLIGPGSRLFEELYAEGLIDESLTIDYTVEQAYAYLTIFGDSLQPERAADKLCSRFEEYIRLGAFDEKRMNELIRSNLGDFLRSLDDVEQAGEAVVHTRLRHLEFSDYASLFFSLGGREMLKELDFVRPEYRTRVIVHGNGREMRKEKKRKSYE